MITRYRFPVLIFATLQWSCSTPKVQTPPSTPIPTVAAAPEDLPSLMACVRDGTTGLTSQEEKEELPAKFNAFADYRKKASAEESKLSFDSCAAELAGNPFCAMFSESAESAKSSSSSLGREKRKQARRIAQYLKKADIENIRKADGEFLRAAFRTHLSGNSIEKLGEKLLAEKGDCELSTANLLVGSRAEEASPEPESIKTALDHYERAAECPTNADGEKALYRMGLIQYWRGKRELADQYLKQVIARPNGDLKARALFWLQQIHQESGDLAGAQGFRATLKSEFPFSLHNLIAQEKYENSKASEGLQADSSIRYRSKAHPELDSWVSAAEFLLKEGRNEQASQLLNAISRKLEGTEPGFQLYLAVLFNRADDYLGKFKLLSALFRTSPQLISKPALELYYPKKSFLGSVKFKLDEFLVLSLIRQESAFNKNARSAAGAIGLMQVMPATARLIDRRTKRSQLYQVDQNVRIGSEYFARLLKKFDGDAELALAAYNAGSKRVEDWLRRYPIDNRILFLDLIPFKETREYVAAITRNYYWYTHLYQKAVADNAGAASGGNKGRLFKLLD